MKGKTDITCGFKEKNFWNCLAKVIGSVIKPDKITTAILWCGGL
jgi:hypothetical protein